MKIQMKGLFLFAGLVFAGVSVAEEPSAAAPAAQESAAVAPSKEIGKKIFDRYNGRGCGACHTAGGGGIPNLYESVNKLSKEDFTNVVTNGRGGMSKAMPGILAVAGKGVTPEVAIESLLIYLKDPS